MSHEPSDRLAFTSVPIPRRDLKRVKDLAAPANPDDPNDWMNDMLCNQLPVELFMAMPNEKSKEWEEFAKRACGMCAVRQTCLVDALKVNDRHVVAGALTPQERDDELSR